MDTADAELFHDIGHDLATLAVLVASVRAERDLTGPVSARMALIEGEIDRLLLLVGTGGDGGRCDDEVELRGAVGAILAVRAAGTSTSVELLAGPEVPRRTNACLLDRLVVNLLDNAIRAAGPTGHVTAEVVAGPPVVIRVCDDGPGPDRGPKGHHGLGLAIVHSLAARLDATVVLHPGRGAGSVAELALDGRPTALVPAPRSPQD